MLGSTSEGQSARLKKPLFLTPHSCAMTVARKSTPSTSPLTVCVKMAKQVSHLTVIVKFAPLCLVSPPQSAQYLIIERSNFNDTAAFGRPSVGRDPIRVWLGWSLGGLSSQVSALAPVHPYMKQNLITTTATTCLNKYYRQFMSRLSSSYSRSGNTSSKVDTGCFNQAVSGASPRVSCLPDNPV